MFQGDLEALKQESEGEVVVTGFHSEVRIHIIYDLSYPTLLEDNFHDKRYELIC